MAEEYYESSAQLTDGGERAVAALTLRIAQLKGKLSRAMRHNAATAQLQQEIAELRAAHEEAAAEADERFRVANQLAQRVMELKADRRSLQEQVAGLEQEVPLDGDEIVFLRRRERLLTGDTNRKDLLLQKQAKELTALRQAVHIEFTGKRKAEEELHRAKQGLRSMGASQQINLRTIATLQQDKEALLADKEKLRRDNAELLKMLGTTL